MTSDNYTILETAFNELFVEIQGLVRVAKETAAPSSLLMQKTIALDHAKTETGIQISRWQLQHFQKTDWSAISFQIFQKIKLLPSYENFRQKLTLIDGQDHNDQLTHAVIRIAGIVFTEDLTNSRELLDFFLKSITYEPVPSWVEIDVCGISVKNTPSIKFDIAGKQLIFRQWDISDFEQESFVSAIPNDSRFGFFPPQSILRIEMDSWRPLDFQIEATKATTLLRLFQPCSVYFRRQAFGSKSPFAMLGISKSGESVMVFDHPVVLTKEIGEKLKNFWLAVEPLLPIELWDVTPQNSTTVSIAYERYCDSLLTKNPIERKVTFAIMGLEAIYLGRDEIQELAYRLQLRACKMLSKLGFKIEEARKHLKEGYSIRNSYVHGGHLSDKEKKKLETRGITVNDLANNLLNYLRLSVLHLIISKQTKKEFLSLLESGLLDRNSDDKLHALMESEKTLLIN